ncbi:hypothetical protein R1sor_008819 [Riccia sorocarpa]|uniref:Uncharacterized protein n=1 Tax=Riccia sorocarpa TaxID=122646 RepID=A0ABD3HUU9_9MARC
MSKDRELDLKGLLTKFPKPIDDMKAIQESYELTDQIPIAEPVNRGADMCSPDSSDYEDRSVVTADVGPSAPASSPTKSDSSGGVVVLDPIFQEFGQKIGPVLADVMS